jgi:acetylornithine deacetylase/succinyl-diaminopimelate desuccinylase-like protein
MVPILQSGSVIIVTLFAAWLSLACAGPRPGGGGSDPGASAIGARAADLLAQAIRIPTVNPPGDERPLAERLVEELRRAGLEAELIETPRGDSQVGRAAAWGVLRGSGQGEPIVLLSHLDVVPAEASDWTVDPFAGVVQHGYVAGRGSLDAKGVAIVHLLTLTELARRGTRLSRDVIFLATPDEETGGLHGAGWVVRHRRDLLGGARYLLTEGGGVAAGDERGSVWGIGVTEKAPCWLRITARGTPGHGSVPGRDGAIPQLVEALARVNRLEMPVRVVPEVAAMYRTLAPRAPLGDERAYRDLAAALVSDEDFRLRFLAQKSSGALVRNTLAITVLASGSATNVIPAVATAHLDARLLPGETCEGFLAEIQRALADPTLRVEPLLAFRANASPVDTPLYRAIARVAEATDPQVIVVPRMNAGFSDAHYFREIGMVAYGFVPRWLRPEDASRIHGPDERISIENLERGVTTLIQILEELDRAR